MLYRNVLITVRSNAVIFYVIFTQDASEMNPYIHSNVSPITLFIVMSMFNLCSLGQTDMTAKLEKLIKHWLAISSSEIFFCFVWYFTNGLNRSLDEILSNGNNEIKES